MPRGPNRCALWLMLAMSGTASSGAPDGVLFYAGFEGSAEAVAVGDGKAEGGDGAPRFAVGKRGSALFAGSDGGHVSYQLARNLKLDEGTIEFWLCPHDWSAATKRFHVFFEAKEPGWLLVYAQAYYGAMLLISDRTDVWSRVNQSIRGFEPGQWHHLAATWNSHDICLYLDGKPSGRRPSPRIPQSVGSRFTVGDRSWHTTQRENSLIDELYIYDRALTDQEVAWAHEHALDRPCGQDVPPSVTPFCAGASLRPFPSQRKLVAEVDANPRHRFPAVIGEVRLGSVAGVEPAPLRRAGEGRASAELRYDELPPGHHDVLISISDPGSGRTDVVNVPLLVPEAPAWRGNRIGIPATPPPPWTDVEVLGGAVAVWGRRYDLGDTGLPRQIVSASMPLLHDAVRLDCEVDGSSVGWTPEPSASPSVTSVAARQSGSARSVLGVLSWTCVAEFDGMVRYDLTLDPEASATVDRMELVFPLRPEHATLHYLTLGYSADRSQSDYPGWGTHRNATYPGDAISLRGATPGGQGTVLRKPGVVYWWLGDEERGLAGFCESDQAWREADLEDAFRIERRDGAVNVVWSFTRRTWALPKPWTFTFGLQATPVKPRQGWRQRRLVRLPAASAKAPPVVGGDTGILWASTQLMPHHGYAEAVDAAAYRAAVQRHHESGLDVVPYSALLALDDQAPEAFYLEEWQNGKFWSSTLHKSHPRFVWPTGDWIDFVVWKNDRYVRELDLDGLYHDGTGVFPSVNRHAGAGYLRDGTVRPTYPYFATRELHKRVYAMLKQHGRERGRDTFMIAHMSTRMEIPHLSFCDATLDGEQFWGMVTDDYLEVMPLDHIRAEYMGHNYGVVPFFLPELHTPEQRKALTPQLVGLALLHDFNLWPIFCDRVEVNRAYRAMDEFGIVDAEFFPYWHNDELVRGQSAEVKCSVYRKDSSALLCVMNVTREPVEAELRVDWAALVGKDKPVVADALASEAAPVSAVPLALRVTGQNYRLLTAK